MFTFGGLCPNLGEVDITVDDKQHGIRWGHQAGKDISSSLCKLHRLRSAKVPYLTTSAIEHLARVPSLTCLTFTIMEDLGGKHVGTFDLGPDVFTHLESLGLSSENMDKATSILKCLLIPLKKDQLPFRNAHVHSRSLKGNTQVLSQRPRNPSTSLHILRRGRGYQL